MVELPRERDRRSNEENFLTLLRAPLCRSNRCCKNEDFFQLYITSDHKIAYHSISPNMAPLDQCSLVKDEGICPGNVPRFYFDQVTIYQIYIKS